MSTTAASSAPSDTQDSDASSKTSIVELDARPGDVIAEKPQNDFRSSVEKTIPLFWLLLAFRIFNAFAIRTFFQPDEYFQALEPAWQLVFGRDAGAWITWEWRYHLRSTLYPYLFACLYGLVDYASVLLGLGGPGRAELLIAAPKTLQALLAALGDYYTWKLGELVYGESSITAYFVLILTVINPFHFFVITRTLSNSLELVLTTIALFLWFTSSPDFPDAIEASRSQTSTGSTTPAPLHESDFSPEPLSRSWLSMAESAERLKGYVAANMDIYNLSRLRLCLLLAAVACVLRITNVLTWIVLASFEFVDYQVAWSLVYNAGSISLWFPRISAQIRDITHAHWILIREVATCGVLTLSAALFLDRTYYQTWTFPPLQFLYFNIAEGISNFYGVHDYTWYFTQGIPLLMGVLIVFLVIAVRRHLFRPPTDPSDFAGVMKHEFAVLAIVIPFMFSFVAHKEVRFIYPLLPLLHVLAAGPAAEYFNPIISATPFSRNDKSSVRRYSLLIAMAFINVLAAVVITQYHQRAPLSVMEFLRHEHETLYHSQPPSITGLASADTTMTVGFLMPCHSTPWRSHLVYPDIKAWALGCEPPIGLGSHEKRLYRDEADRFYDDPTMFLLHELGTPPKASGDGHKPGFGLHGEHGRDIGWDGRAGKRVWPEYLVFFEEKEKLMFEILHKTDYVQCWRGWNSWFHDDWRRRGDIIVLCHRRRPFAFAN